MGLQNLFLGGGNGIDMNREFRGALNQMENTPDNIFITGRAGTGKSTLLEYFRSVTKKNVVVLRTHRRCRAQRKWPDHTLLLPFQAGHHAGDR